MTASRTQSGIPLLLHEHPGDLPTEPPEDFEEEEEADLWDAVDDDIDRDQEEELRGRGRLRFWGNET